MLFVPFCRLHADAVIRSQRHTPSLTRCGTAYTLKVHRFVTQFWIFVRSEGGNSLGTAWPMLACAVPSVRDNSHQLIFTFVGTWQDNLIQSDE